MMKINERAREAGELRRIDDLCAPEKYDEQNESSEATQNKP